VVVCAPTDAAVVVCAPTDAAVVVPAPDPAAFELAVPLVPALAATPAPVALALTPLEA
jgi:hypothetical protein